MIGTCARCGVMFEGSEETVCAPGVVCPTCHWTPEAIRLLDTFGPWTGDTIEESRAWWERAGYANAPAVPQLWGLVAAVKLEQVRREFAAMPEGATPFAHFRPRAGE